MKLLFSILPVLAISLLLTACNKPFEVKQPAQPAPAQKKAPAPQNNTPEAEKEPAQEEPQNTLKEDVDFVFLDATDVRELTSFVEVYFEAYTYEVLGPIVPEGHSGIKTAAFKGKLGDFEVSAEFFNGEKIDFKNINLQLNKEGRSLNGEFSLIAICVGSDCNKVFATVYIREKGGFGGGFVYNWPLVFKRVASGEYMPAFQKKDEAYDEPTGEEEVPPQVKVTEQLKEKLAEKEADVLTAIREKMRQADAVYSGMFFLGMDRLFPTLEFKKEGSSLEFSLVTGYLPRFNRPNLEFSGKIEEIKETAFHREDIQTDLHLIPFDGTDLFAILFDQKNYKALLPGADRGMAAIICSIVVENTATYYACELMPSSTVLGTIAWEGKADGPIYVKDGEIIDKAPPKKDPSAN